MKQQNPISRDRSVVATFIISIVIIAVFVFTYVRADRVIRERSLLRMQEGVKTVVEEVINRLEVDSQILNAAADIFATADLTDDAATLKSIEAFVPLFRTMDICILMPDNHIIQPEGPILDGSGSLDFATEAALGEHVSNRVESVGDESTYLIRHFVPIEQNGEVVALVYGRTKLDDLPGQLNIGNIYNASADVYIIDTDNGELLMDTRHEKLGVLDDFVVGDVRGDTSWEEIKAELLDLQSGYMTVEAKNEGSEWLNFYYMPAGINQWSIAVSVPEDMTLESLYLLRRVFYLSAFLMCVAIVIYFIWTRQNAKRTMQEAVDRALLEEKLEKSEAAAKAKTIFLSNMSHDIRTPMNAIIGFTTLARTNIDNKERVQEYMDKILSSSNYLLSLINDILDMSRIESGKLNIEEKACSISEIFRDMRNIIHTQMQSKQLTFFMDTVDVVDEDIFCDKVHLNQVLLNLLSNAIKFTPAGGQVFLTVTQFGDAPEGYGDYEIRVKDTGIGMSADFMKHIFEPFERERNTTVSGIQGTGLGMSITKNIVDAMGGTIEVKSKEGHGSEFIIRLRLRLQSEHKTIEIIEGLEGKRILVVDDNFSTCDSMAKMLDQMGMQAEWTMHGREAVLRAQQAQEMDNEFFAYIVDWALPDLSGLEVVRQIRSIVGPEALIAVMTAYDWSTFEKEAREAGANEFCDKPVFLSDLQELLGKAVKGPGAEEPEENFLHAIEELAGKRLLVVEDNELNREIAEELLTESGFIIETAEDGTVAVERVKAAEAHWYDLILMDIQMPIMNGYEATKAIRALDDPEKASVPIVAMTANAFEEDKQQALASGMNAHVGKPINVDELMETIQRTLRGDKGAL